MGNQTNHFVEYEGLKIKIIHGSEKGFNQYESLMKKAIEAKNLLSQCLLLEEQMKDDLGKFSSINLI